jgi:flagellar hook-associated protein 3 FlgL
MRITQQMMDRSMLSDMNRSLSRLAESQQRVGSEKKITKPSDAPGDLQALLAVKDQLSVSEQYKTNIESAQLRMQKADSGITNIYEELLRAKETLVAGTGAMAASARAVLGEIVEGVLKNVMEELNARDGNEYVFAGTDSAAAPFTAARGPDSDGTDRIQTVTYGGNSAVREIDISATQTTTTGLTGAELAGTGAGGVLETLIALRKAVVSGADTTLLQASLDANIARLDQLQVKLGAQLQAVSGLSASLEGATLNMEARRSSIEDTDFTRETLEQGRRQVEYQAVLAVTAKRSQLSLLNYI